MKKKILFVASILAGVALLMSSCSVPKKCHHCGNAIPNDPVETGGRTYCSYNCYMTELIFD